MCQRTSIVPEPSARPFAGKSCVHLNVKARPCVHLGMKGRPPAPMARSLALVLLRMTGCHSRERLASDATADHRLKALVIDENVVRHSAACRTASWFRLAMALQKAAAAVKYPPRVA